ncbi:unnamed protein product, partial [Brassica rapa subsp. narinosa]
LLLHRPNIKGRRRDVEDSFVSFLGDREEEEGGLEKDLSSSLLCRNERLWWNYIQELEGLADPMRKEV